MLKDLSTIVSDVLTAEKILESSIEDLRNNYFYEEADYLHQRRTELTSFIEELGELD